MSVCAAILHLHVAAEVGLWMFDYPLPSYFDAVDFNLAIYLVITVCDSAFDSRSPVLDLADRTT